MKREHFVVGSSASLLLSLLVPTVSEPIMAQTKPPIETVIPTVPFCDMVKTPAKYFDKTVRITAEISLTGDSGQYLNDAACPLHRDDAIGVGVPSDKDFGLVLMPPLRMILHQAVRVEWDNLLSYPELKATRKKPLLEQEITFLVVSSKVKRVTPTRWNKTIHCKIL